MSISTMISVGWPKPTGLNVKKEKNGAGHIATFSWDKISDASMVELDPSGGGYYNIYWRVMINDEKTYLAPNQKNPLCETGLMFPSSWDDGYGNGYGEKNYEGYGSFMFSMTDKLQVPKDIESGEYSLSWRWDCEQTPQVWNSCADITIEQ